MNEEIATTVKQVLARQLGFRVCEIEADNTLDFLGTDSLDRVEIAMALEEAYYDAFDLTDDEIEKCNTVGDLIRLVGDKLT